MAAQSVLWLIPHTCVVSISCTVVMVLLFISSLSEYLSSTTTSQMLIDDSPSEMKLKVIFSIEFTKVPCGFIYTDNQDLLGFSAVRIARINVTH